MSIADEIEKGIRFRICGKFAGTLRFTNEKTGDVGRFIRIRSMGKTYSLAVDSDEELAAAPPEETPCRVGGEVGRRSRTMYASVRVQSIVTPQDKDWKDITDEERLAGMGFSGWVLASTKRSGVYQGNEWRKYLVQTFGDCIEFSGMEKELFANLPERCPVYVKGFLDPKISTGERGQNADLVFVLEDALTVDQVQKRPRTQAEKPAA